MGRLQELLSELTNDQTMQKKFQDKCDTACRHRCPSTMYEGCNAPWEKRTTIITWWSLPISLALLFSKVNRLLPKKLPNNKMIIWFYLLWKLNVSGVVDMGYVSALSGSSCQDSRRFFKIVWSVFLFENPITILKHLQNPWPCPGDDNDGYDEVLDGLLRISNTSIVLRWCLWVILLIFASCRCRPGLIRLRIPA